MDSYVCGFLIGVGADPKVALIEKKRGGDHIQGNWNGIGGRCDPNEYPLDAMRREFEEETGVDVVGWKKFARLIGHGREIDFFYFIEHDGGETAYFERVSTVTDEEVALFQLGSTPPNVVTNLTWLLGMAAEAAIAESNGQSKVYDIFEV